AGAGGYFYYMGLNEGNVELDNGGEKTLKVTVDELTYVLQAGGTEVLQLEKGRHRLLIKDEDGETIEESVFLVENGGIINAAQVSYIVWADLYGDPALRESKLQEEFFSIEGVEKVRGKDKKVKREFMGEFNRLDKENYYIEQTWHYGLAEDWPDERYDWRPTEEKYQVRRKVYREQALFTHLNSLATPLNQ
ncbi:MAG: hypothetical protein AAF206_26450, partial [Bacteroidota bacterium]